MQEEYSSKLPHNLEAEKYIIASLLIDKSNFDRIVDFQLHPSDFYDDKYKNIYLAIIDLFQNDQPIDIISVTEKVKNKGNLEQSGGASFISSLIDSIPTGANIAYHAKLVKNKSKLRQLITIAQNSIANAYQNSDNVTALIEEAEKELFELNQDLYNQAITPVSEIINKNIEKWSKRNSGIGHITGVPSGYSDLDEVTNGFKSGELIILAARPSAGKTSLALNITANCAIRHEKKVGFFSAEMTQEAVVKRLLCSEAGMNLQRFDRGIISQQEYADITQAASKIYDSSIFFDDKTAISIIELRSKARRMKREYDIDILFIDYLQLLTTGDQMSNNVPRHEQVAFISRSLKALAKELKIPVIALAQLNRNVESRGGKDSRPKMSDLKDSGSIEQDADVIMFIHRKQNDEEQGDVQNQDFDIRELIVEKNRSGPQGIIRLTFQKIYTRFQSFTKQTDDY